MAEIDVPAAVRTGYAFDGPVVELGALVVGEGCDPTAKVRIPLSMVNRHGLVAGATGTGKTKTLQTMAEQLSAAGVPVFLADIKGDLSGMAAPGAVSDRVTTRATDIGYDWQPAAYPVEFFALGGRGKGVPVRATVTSFGPTLLAKVLGLNDVQESSLGLVFHFADKNALPLLDLADLRAVIQHLTSPAGAAELAELGGLSKATAGVILRELIAFADQGAEDFFGETEFDTRDFLRAAPDGRGMVSILELPSLQDQPQLFATFLMWFLADLFDDLPEVGDVEKPKLVFFFDEAHLLFRDASKDFLAAITQTVRLIRSKGVGVFFVTQTPKDVPGDVLAQLGNRVQHALRAYTPEDAKALKATVSTFPRSGYDLEEVLTQLGTGEAVITVLSERGAPSPVAWTRLPPPRSLMAQVDAAVADGIVAASPLTARYGARIDRESAYEMLLAKVAVKPPAAPTPGPAPAPAPQREREAKPEKSFLEKALGNAAVRGALRSAATAAAREITRSIFGTARKRR
jgi:DNA helicase HerA-like ATPase